MALICSNADATPRELINPIEISGKILDQYGKPFTEEVEIKISVSIFSYDPTVDLEHQESYENKIYKIPARGGVFSWKGEGSGVTVEAIKEGYHSTRVDVQDVEPDETIKSSDILIYVVPKGTPSKLEFIEGAEIPSKKRKESGGKKCGWSFKKLWYFPVDEEDSVWLTITFDEAGNAFYTMKEPGGFVYFPGYPDFESKLDRPRADFDLMTEAPEEGYIQSVSPWRDHRAQQEYQYGGVYYYFRTPDGKYGKIAFDGRWFDYYLQPDGSRNLEAGEVDEVGPVNPIEQEWEDKWKR